MPSFHAKCGAGPPVPGRQPSSRPFAAISTAIYRSISACLTLALVVLAAGCRTYEPIPLDPDGEWSALVKRERHLAVDSDPLLRRNTEEPQWIPLSSEIDASDGISLSEASTIALFYNPAIVQARHAANVTSAQLLQAGLLENPDLFVGPRFSTRSSDVVLPISLSWEIPLWGKRSAEEDVAQAQSRRSTLDLQVQELQVLVDVRHAYVRLWRVSRELAVLQSLERTTGLVTDWVNRLQAAGEIDGSTAWLTSWEQSQVKVLERKKRGEHRLLVSHIFQILGLLPSASVEVDVAGSDRVPELSDARLELLRRHPRVRSAEELYEVSQAELRLEIAKQYPSVRIGPEFEDDAGHSTVGFGLGIELPLFDRNRGGIAAAEERRNGARDGYRSVLLALAHEEAKARAEAATTTELLALLRAGPTQRADDALRDLEARLQLGLSSVLEVLATQRALTEARLEEIRLEAELIEAVFSASVAGGSALKAPPETATEERNP